MSALSAGGAVLVAVPDWGLGHATRSLVVVERLRALGIPVHLASSGRAGHLLRAECPDLPFLELPGYRIRYRSSALAIDLLRQAPRFWSRVRAEHRSLARYLKKHPIRAILSDNALGCHAPGLPSAYMTHQLHMQYPAAPWLARPFNRLHRCIMGRFDSCWVPDWPGRENLSGLLAHPPHGGLRIRYLGPLSRMRPLPEPHRWDAVAVLSGPEPQRSRWEARLVHQLSHSNARILLVRGTTEVAPAWEQRGRMRWVSWLPAAQLNRELAAAAFVICRPGYSSLMDLAALGKPAVLVPTPGQTEQEYLARHWARQWGYPWEEQRRFRWAFHWRRRSWAGCRPPQMTAKAMIESLDELLLPFLRRAGFSV